MKFAILFVVAAIAPAQQLDLKALDHLSAKAKESANVDLDADKLKFASQFLSDRPKDEHAKQVISQMKGIFVRTFEFDSAGAWSQTDLEGIRKQLAGPGWSRVIEVKEEQESAEIYFFSESGGLGGLAVIAAEPRELAVVNIVGPVNMEALARLGGTLGIPSIQSDLLGGKRKPNPSYAPNPKK